MKFSSLIMMIMLRLSVAIAIVPNLMPNLIPPHNGGWRGSTLGNLNQDPSIFTSKYGASLHIARIFGGNISSAQAAFIKGGGILWYDVGVSNWTEAATDPAYVPIIEHIADLFLSVAPAQMFLCIDHEPDHNVDTISNTAPAYRAMWAKWQLVFADRNVTNAVWVMDFSTQLAGPNAKERVAAAEALWPAPLARVDWLFFNVFQKKSFPSFSAIAESIYASLVALNVSGIDTVPIGIGAFGSKLPLQDSTRADFLNFAAKDLNDAALPRLRAAIYFDSLDSIVNGTQMLAEYKKYIQTPFFTANDNA